MLTIAERVLFARGSMSQVRQDHPTMLARAEEIQRQIHHLSSRDTQLWSIVTLIVLILTCGFLAVVAPNLVWAQRVFRVQQAYLPQLFFGLISLIILLNIYFLSQRVALNSTRKALISELVVMPDTSEPQAEFPLQRLLKIVEEWNISNDKAYQLSFAWGMAGYVTGTSLEEIL